MNASDGSKEFTSKQKQVCLARQPILDRRCNVIAYELLFRTPGSQTAKIDNAGEATINVVTNAFTNIGVETLLGGKKAYINFDATLLKSDITKILPKDKIVIEIVETVEIDDDLLSSLRRLHSEGYRFALDDFIHRDEIELLYQFVDIIKLDITLYEKETLIEQVEYFQKHNKVLLAEKVETQNEFELCRTLGFKLFQGYFFAKPTIITQGDLPASKRHLIDIMNAVMEDADSRMIEEKIIRDVSVSCKLLKFVNSAGLTRGQELDSINDALVMIGRKQLYRWLSILLFSTDDVGDKQPNALFNAAIYRGRLLEVFGEITHHKNPADLFVLGTFSYLEALLQRNLSQILKDMIVPTLMKDALLENKGEYWPYLDLAIKLEKGEFEKIDIKSINLTVEQVNHAQLNATAYCEFIT